MLTRGGHLSRVDPVLLGTLLSTVLLIMISCSPDNVNGDYTANCKTKFRNMWLKYCAGDNVRRKRESAPQQQDDKVDEILSSTDTASVRVSDKRAFSHQEVAELFDFAAPIIAKLLRGRHQDQLQGEDYSARGYSGGHQKPGVGLGFQPPKSGDDLGMGIGGLSADDVEDLIKEMMERLPRAVKNKNETIKMITSYAARCCNENLSDAGCSNPADVINCP